MTPHTVGTELAIRARPVTGMNRDSRCPGCPASQGRNPFDFTLCSAACVGFPGREHALSLFIFIF